ncbi:phage tail protein [Klebsiella pneumoniae]|uniref:phage tail protein n=1 Tax=Klebsiella pneumoniae TaxID=573 RepID=UPI001D0D5354|nr:phage tail protein [Klebsiella pneumoniae]
MPVSRYLCIFINVGLGEGSALPVGVPVPWPSAIGAFGCVSCCFGVFCGYVFPFVAFFCPTTRFLGLRFAFLFGCGAVVWVGVVCSVFRFEGSAPAAHVFCLPFGSMIVSAWRVAFCFVSRWFSFGYISIGW